MTFISGPYSWTYDGKPLGVIEDSVQVSEDYSGEIVTGDNLGDQIQTIINRGKNVYMSMVCQEWDLLQAALGTSLNFTTGCPRVGKRIVGTAISCATPANWVANNAVLAPAFSARYQLGSRLRNVPIVFLLMPSVVAFTSDSNGDPIDSTNVNVGSLFGSAVTDLSDLAPDPTP